MTLSPLDGQRPPRPATRLVGHCLGADARRDLGCRRSDLKNSADRVQPFPGFRRRLMQWPFQPMCRTFANPAVEHDTSVLHNSRVSAQCHPRARAKDSRCCPLGWSLPWSRRPAGRRSRQLLSLVCRTDSAPGHLFSTKKEEDRPALSDTTRLSDRGVFSIAAIAPTSNRIRPTQPTPES